MANQRDPNKRMVGFFATKEEKALLQAAALKGGFENLTDYLRWVAVQGPLPEVTEDEDEDEDEEQKVA